MLLSELLSRPAINLKTGDFEGIVKNISYLPDLSVAERLFIFDEDADADDAAVPVEAVYSAGDAVVVCDSQKMVRETDPAVFSPVNCKVYDKSGVHAGYVRDVDMQNDFVVKYLILDTGLKLTPKDILVSGRYTIILSAPVKKPRAKRKPKSPPHQPAAVAAPPPDASTERPHAASSTGETQKIPLSNERATDGAKNSVTPIRILADFAFLLGRMVAKDISVDGQLIIPKNTVITAETVIIAHKNNRLYDLTVNAYL